MASADVATNRDEARSLVQDIIDNNPVAVFSRTWCPHSADAKAVFAAVVRNPDDVDVEELDLRPDEDLLIAVLGDMTGAPTTPRCFVGGKFIGGGDDVMALAQTGALQRQLQQQGLEVKQGAEAPYGDIDAGGGGIGALGGGLGAGGGALGGRGGILGVGAGGLGDVGVGALGDVGVGGAGLGGLGAGDVGIGGGGLGGDVGGLGGGIGLPSDTGGLFMAGGDIGAGLLGAGAGGLGGLGGGGDVGGGAGAGGGAARAGGGGGGGGGGGRHGRHGHHGIGDSLAEPLVPPTDPSLAP